MRSVVVFTISSRCTHPLCTQKHWTHSFHSSINIQSLLFGFHCNQTIFTMLEIRPYSEKNLLPYFIKYKQNHNVNWRNSQTDLLASGTQLPGSLPVANSNNSYYFHCLLFLWILDIITPLTYKLCNKVLVLKSGMPNYHHK